MYIVKNDDLIVLAAQTMEELEPQLEYVLYTSVEETDEEYILYSNGEYVTRAKFEELEQERIATLSLTKREVFLALYKDKGITPEQLRSQITDAEALIEFDYANDYFRGNPLIDKIGLMLGYSSNDLDYLFEHKELPKKEGE